MSKTWVYYHGGGCYDGFTAAWVAKRALRDAELIPAVYQTPLPRVNEIKEGDVVYFVDYSRPRDELTYLASFAQVIVLDHHASAQRDLADLRLPSGSVVRFDMERSGAGMTWDWFFGRGSRPIAIHYVEDRDLWAGKYPETARFHAYLTSLPMDFAQWDIAMSDENVERALAEGGAIERAVQQYAEKAMAFARTGTTLLGQPLVLFNLPPMNVSETLYVALERFPSCTVAASYQIRGDRLAVSLRSRPDGPDVGLMAKTLGGGGHARAAGFECEIRSVLAQAIMGVRDWV